MISSTPITYDSVKSLGSLVRQTDNDPVSGLSMYCYEECNNDSPSLLKQTRGLVFNENHELVLQTFGYTDEYNCDKVRNSSLQDRFSDFDFYDAYEGSTIRVFKTDKNWHISTHRKLNAFRSRWSSRTSFGQTFKEAIQLLASQNGLWGTNPEEALPLFLKSLDPKYSYAFLLMNTRDNRIVCEAPDVATVFHIGTFDKTHCLVPSVSVGVPMPVKHDFASVDQMLEFVRSTDHKYQQGLIARDRTNPNYQVKILNTYYQELFETRGNQPSIKFRYLQLRQDGGGESLDRLRYLYPEMVPEFERYEEMILDVAKAIYGFYVSRFIKKEFVKVHPALYRVMTACHGWHIQDRARNRINFNRVLVFVNQSSASAINHMIRAMNETLEESVDESVVV